MNAGGRFEQAVLLAAGRGSRMGAATEHVPKCLCPIAGRPLLAWTLDALRASGVEKVLIVAGWQHQQLVDWGTEIVVNTRWAETNMVRSLQLADAWLRQAGTLVVYGDGAYAPGVFDAVLNAPHADVFVPGDRLWHELWSRRFADPLEDAESWRSAGDRLLEIGARAHSMDDIGAQFMGLLRVTPQGWNAISRRLKRWEANAGSDAIDRMHMTGMLGGLIEEGMPIHCSLVDGGWVEIDSEHDRDVIERALSDEELSHDFRR